VSASANTQDVPWDSLLLELQDPTSLVSIARERRLVLDDGRAPRWVDLCWVDEVALALIDLAVWRGRNLDLVYPAPAGEVAVLLAAQLLLRQFQLNQSARPGTSPLSLGLVTADPTMAERIWRQLRIATRGDRVPIEEVFGCYRAGPDGESPVGGRRFTGIIIGQACSRWPVDYLVVDHLAGLVRVEADKAAVEVFADPLDRALVRAEEGGRLIWGWSDADVTRWNEDLEIRREYTVPFSVAEERLLTMAGGVDVTVAVARHTEAEAAIRRAREDLRLLRALAPASSDRNVTRGLSAAWHHLTTLTSLPCKPTHFDRFAGWPPWAARSTRTFEPELSAWATTLTGDMRDIAEILASDISDLRAALELGNPLETALKAAAEKGTETLVVTRTRTASRALTDALGGDPDGAGVGCLTMCAIGRLHRQGTWPRALMIGEPSPWDWHRLLSGLAGDLTVITLGEDAAKDCGYMVAAVRDAREHWGGTMVRGRTWQALVGTQPPPPPAPVPTIARPTVVVDGAEFVPPPDPFTTFASLFQLDPLDIGGEGTATGLAHETEQGEWAAAVPAVAVNTDQGRVLLEVGRSVEVRVGPKIVDRRTDQIRSGDVLLIGRRQGRVGLLEALEERLAHRPDLLAARMLIDRYHRLVREHLADTGLSYAALHRKLVSLGCDKTSFATRSWVIEGGIMAPRDRIDLQRLAKALDLGMSDRQIDELFAGVQRRRVFRRAAGRVLAQAARSSTLVDDAQRVDTETGLSIADLRDAVVEAVVLDVSPCDEPVPVTLLGRLEPS
jgi:hypothetical protein